MYTRILQVVFVLSAFFNQEFVWMSPLVRAAFSSHRIFLDLIIVIQLCTSKSAHLADEPAVSCLKLDDWGKLTVLSARDDRMQLWWLGMMMVSAVFYYCSLNRERSSFKRGSARPKDWLPLAVITNLLASSRLRLNAFPRDPVFMFWISELSDLITRVKRRIASVGLNNSDCLLLFEDVADYHHQIYYLFIYLFSHSPFLFSQVYV